MRTLARVRQVGPDLPSGVRRPDRSVSLRDVNELSVETAGLADAGWSASVAKPGAWSSDAESWEELLSSGPYVETVVQAGKFDVTLQLDDIREVWGEAGTAEGLHLSPKGDVRLNFEVHPEANASEMTPGEVRESLRLVGEIAESLQDEGFNVMANPMSPQHGRLYRQFGMVPQYEEDSQLRDGLDPLVLPGRDDSYGAEDRFHYLTSQGLSDEDRRLMEQPGGFAPSPPMSGVMPGASLQPPRLPDVGGFQASPPMSGLLPGAPIRGPQGPTVLSMEGQQALPGMEPPPPWALTPKQIATGKEWLPKVRDTLEGTRPPVDSPQSQMSQTMLADMFAQQAQQMDFQNREQAAWKSAGLGSASDPSSNMLGGIGGFLGNVLSARQNAPTALPYAQAGQLSMNAANNLSTEQKIALALLAGAVTGGMSTPMMVPALGIGAGLAAG